MVKQAIRFLEFCFYLFILSIKWRKKIINSSTLTMFLNLFQDYLKKIVMKVRDGGDDGQVTTGGDGASQRKVLTLRMGRGRERESFSLFFSYLLMVFFHHYNLQEHCSIIHSTSTTPPEIVDVFENLVLIVENNTRNEKDGGGGLLMLFRGGGAH